MDQAPLMYVFGAGYLATFLARAACAQGWRVAGLTRNPERKASLLEAGFEKVVLDELDREDWWKSFLEVPDCVVNCVSSAGGGLEGYRQSYVAGNRSILGWASQHSNAADFSRATFIYTGSTGVYPDRSGDWVQESDVASELEGRSAILREAESLVLEKSMGIFRRAFVLRLAGLYGPGRLFLARQLLDSGTVAGTGDYYLNLLRIEDAASSILACADAGAKTASQIFNVSDGNPALKAEIVSWLGQKLGLKPPYLDPEKETGFRRRGTKNRRVDSRAIRKTLDWEPGYPDYRTGFQDLIKA